MAISPYIAKLREKIGTELLLLPSACVIPKDAQGRLLMAKQADSGKWATIGGTIEPGESPEQAAIREAKEEASIDVELSLVTVLGGPDYVITYSNGDRSQYVSTVFEAQIVGGVPAPDQEETLAVGWFAPHELDVLDMSSFTRALLRDLGYLRDGRNSRP
jgi:8-oxo-dGTP pyrophosphatase MutT (NUDIX family)